MGRCRNKEQLKHTEPCVRTLLIHVIEIHYMHVKFYSFNTDYTEIRVDRTLDNTYNEFMSNVNPHIASPGNTSTRNITKIGYN